MDYTRMILTEHLVNSVINPYTDKDFNLIFKINNNFYIGSFIKTDEHYRNYTLSFDGMWGYNKNYNIFNIDNVSTTQNIRSAFFEFAFGNEKNSVNMEKYIFHPDFVLRDIISFAEQYESEFLNPTVKDIKCIYNLKNIDTGKTFEFYLISDEDIVPISLVKQEN
ncbi:hypothetical protein LMF32_12255 [Desemzia sp. C1]|uniref:hypothetical protein n=1 Tax=Desemzia sp. C1 TaxID=2892016 RepID=UPI001E5D16E7|nr:hypothetical protein [Desemzia sp. C1]MCI3029817.1 hypothetical protein [Desemzia sp. C1]